jgi:hypothetical protein
VAFSISAMAPEAERVAFSVVLDAVIARLIVSFSESEAAQGQQVGQGWLIAEHQLAPDGFGCCGDEYGEPAPDQRSTVCAPSVLRQQVDQTPPGCLRISFLPDWISIQPPVSMAAPQSRKPMSQKMRAASDTVSFT